MKPAIYPFKTQYASLALEGLPWQLPLSLSLSSALSAAKEDPWQPKLTGGNHICMCCHLISIEACNDPPADQGLILCHSSLVMTPEH